MVLHRPVELTRLNQALELNGGKFDVAIRRAQRIVKKYLSLNFGMGMLSASLLSGTMGYQKLCVSNEDRSCSGVDPFS
jgi:hypothetical protein